MAIKKERSLQWKSETVFFGMKQPPFHIPADYNYTISSSLGIMIAGTQTYHKSTSWVSLSQLRVSRVKIFFGFAARKRSTCLTWRVFIWGAVWLVFAVSRYICESLTLMAECIDSTLTKRMSNACKFLQHQNSRFVYFMLKLNLTIKSQY